MNECSCCKFSPVQNLYNFRCQCILQTHFRSSVLSVLIQITAKQNAVPSWESRCKMAQLIMALSSNGYEATSDCPPSEFWVISTNWIRNHTQEEKNTHTHTHMNHRERQDKTGLFFDLRRERTELHSKLMLSQTYREEGRQIIQGNLQTPHSSLFARILSQT